MNIWQMLEIDPTTDITVIKKAYAARAKQCHPEEHPEEFQKLQKAYKSAVKWAKMAQNSAETEPEEINVEAEAVPEEISVEAVPEEISVEAEAVPEEIGTEAEAVPEADLFDFGKIESYGAQRTFFQEFEAMTWNPMILNNTECWKLFLERPGYAELLEEEEIRRKLVKRICRVRGWKKKTIWFWDRRLKHPHDLRWLVGKFLFWEPYCLPLEKCMTGEQKNLHKLLISKGKQMIQDGKWENSSTLRKMYIERYLQYALSPRQNVKGWYLWCCKKRREESGMLTAAVAAAAALAAILLFTVAPGEWIRWAKKAVGAETAQQTETARPGVVEESSTAEMDEQKIMSEEDVILLDSVESVCENVLEQYETIRQKTQNSADAEK